MRIHVQHPEGPEPPLPKDRCRPRAKGWIGRHPWMLAGRGHHPPKRAASPDGHVVWAWGVVAKGGWPPPPNPNRPGCPFARGAAGHIITPDSTPRPANRTAP